jgi:hypothetical protein
MSLDREEQMLVMQLADGELDGAEREAAMNLVESRPEAAALLAEIGFVGDWARESQRDGSEIAGRFDIATDLEAQVSSQQPMVLDAARDGKVETIRTARHDSLPQVTSLDAERKRRAARRTQIGAVVGALAVAAAALLVVRAQDRASVFDQQQQAMAMQLDLARGRAGAMGGLGAMMTAPTSSASSTSSATPATGSALALGAQPAPTGSAVPASPHGDVEVNGVDAREHDVTVFYPPAGDPNSSVVVWIEEPPR